MTSQVPRHLLLLAAGQGHRAGGSVPKQYRTDGRGLSILRHTLQRALDAVTWDSIVVAAPAAWVERTRVLLDGLAPTPVIVVPGASDRMDSLRQALAAGGDQPDAICAVHDGVRPCTPPQLFRSVIAQVESSKFDACWPGSVSRDTVLQSTSESNWSVVPASQLLIASTPIAVRQSVVVQALGSDSAVEGILIDRLISTGATWTHVENSWWNFKVTTPSDVNLARAVLDSDLLIENPLEHGER